MLWYEELTGSEIHFLQKFDQARQAIAGIVAEFGFVMMTNVAGAPADEALRKLAADLYKSFFDKPPS
jgi:hypothetical protein